VTSKNNVVPTAQNYTSTDAVGNNFTMSRILWHSRKLQRSSADDRKKTVGFNIIFMTITSNVAASHWSKQRHNFKQFRRNRSGRRQLTQVRDKRSVVSIAHSQAQLLS